MNKIELDFGRIKNNSYYNDDEPLEGSVVSENGEEMTVDETEEVEITDDFIISTITPFSMNTVLHPTLPENSISSMFYLAQSKSGETYIFYTSYLVDNMEKDLISMLPFHYDSNFASFRISSDIIINSLPAFITDFDFRDDPENNNYRYSILANHVIDGNNNEGTYRFFMTSDVFCSLKYIDNYIIEGDVNNYELSMATISAREKEQPSEVVVVDKIDRIVAMAQMKDSDTCAIEFIVNSGDDRYTLLSTFNLGKKFNKKKFKGMTVDKINSVFLSESDQYLQIFSEFCRFNNIDKEYLIIKSRNKDGINKIFFIDGTIRMEFECMIGEY